MKNSFDFIQNFRGKLGMIDIFDLETNNQNIQQQQNAYNLLTPRQNIYNRTVYLLKCYFESHLIYK